MDFGLSQPQTLLKSSIRDFVAQHLPIDRVRSIMSTDSGSDRDLHRQLGDQGIAGLLIPLEHGGVDLDLLDATIAAQELGRAAAPVSFHSAYVMAPLLLNSNGTDEQKAAWLPGIAGGTRLVTVVGDGVFERDGKLDGGSLFVPDALIVDAYIVRAASGSSTKLYLVPSDRKGIEVTPLHNLDETRRLGEVQLGGVEIAAGDEMTGGDASQGFARAVDAGRIALSADALSAAQEGHRIAVEYAKQREQFDRLIASFQAVKHMCAEVIAEIDPVQSLVWFTANAWDTGAEEAVHLVPLLKSHATETATQATATTTQVFGGIGFTHECDSHLYFKRAGYDRQMLGGPSEMRRLAADLQFPG
jgi:alkylation response protein AidB-like acyl-CoA dehydrogenase